MGALGSVTELVAPNTHNTISVTVCTVIRNLFTVVNVVVVAYGYHNAVQILFI